MQRMGKNTVLQAVMASVCALLLTLAIYLSGTCLGNFLLQMQRSYRIDLFNRAMTGQNAVVRMVESEKLHTVTTQYVKALMDAVIQFEFFPRQGDAESFLAIISALPGQTDIERFQFTGHNLEIFCHSPKAEDLERFARELQESPVFHEVSLEMYQKTDGAYSGTLVCIAFRDP